MPQAPSTVFLHGTSLTEGGVDVTRALEKQTQPLGGASVLLARMALCRTGRPHPPSKLGTLPATTVKQCVDALA